jgi:hypothetical protein
MRARREADVILFGLSAPDVVRDYGLELRAAKEKIASKLVELYEAEDLLEQHEGCGECDCGQKLTCERCEGEPVCSACGDVVGPVVCRDCCPEEDAA